RGRRRQRCRARARPRFVRRSARFLVVRGVVSAIGEHMKATLLLSCVVMLGVASQAPSAQQSSAQLAFARLKALAGTWKGRAAQPGGDIGNVRVSMRVTSGGDALMHEMVPEGRSNDPTDGEDDPITMLYIENDRLMLTHYCDSGKNRPRMVGKVSGDGKS